MINEILVIPTAGLKELHISKLQLKGNFFFYLCLFWTEFKSNYVFFENEASIIY